MQIKSDGITRWLKFGRSQYRPDVAASYDGRQLYIVGEVNPIPLSGRKTKQGIDIGTVIAIAYTTKRDGVVERYVHQFRPHSRPTLFSLRGGTKLRLAGGAYLFKDSGINDL